MSKLSTRWIIYAGLAAVVILAYITSIQLDTRPSPQVQKAYNYFENLPESTIIMISFDHEASSLPEIQPITLAILRHAFRRNLRIIGLSLFAEGTAIGYRFMTRVAEEFGKEYGRDYVFLGFKPQHISAILGMGESIIRVFPEDYLGYPADSLPLMRQVYNYNEIEMVISIADGDRGIQWIEYAGAGYNQSIMCGLTAAMVTSYDPYIASGQLYCTVGGLAGAAEYENLFGKKGAGNRGLLAQSMAHIYVIILILIGNVVYFKSRRRRNSGP